MNAIFLPNKLWSYSQLSVPVTFENFIIYFNCFEPYKMYKITYNSKWCLRFKIVFTITHENHAQFKIIWEKCDAMYIHFLLLRKIVMLQFCKSHISNSTLFCTRFFHITFRNTLDLHSFVIRTSTITTLQLVTIRLRNNLNIHWMFQAYGKNLFINKNSFRVAT